MNPRARLRTNLELVEQRIVAACARVGRPRPDVTLIAVTKTVSAEVAALLPGLGVHDLGESRPQTLWSKAAALPQTVRWHQIGHLQRNKIERTLPLVVLTHSVDSLRLLDAIADWSRAHERRSDVLLEFNLSGEPNKSGFAAEESAAIADRLKDLSGVSVRGLMTMAALMDDPEHCRPTFATLRQLWERLRALVGDRHPLEHLSMGMTQDFEIAIEEGATLIRIGSALFEGLP